MTQLNLSGRPSNNPQQKSAAEPEGESIKNQTVGALGALAMFAAVIVIGSCSRSSKPVAMQQPVQPAAPPAVTTPATPPVPVLAQAKARKRRAATLSYVNREYGLSFTFPRNYRLKTGKAAQSASVTPEPAQMNFVHQGGVMLAAVEMPGNSYPGTDFKSGMVNVSVNPGMTAEACAQFSLPEAGLGAEASSPVKVDDVRIGTIDFHQVENSNATLKQPDARYYHVFSSGACYEFALGIATDGDVNVEEITPVDREQVFGKLEKILATVKLQPGLLPETQTSETQLPETQIPVPSVAATTPADSSTTTEHAATKPNF